MKRDIFVSSTFKDFQVEREIMLKEIEAEINDELHKKSLGVNFIDLRWGIDTSKGGLETVITFCIDYVNQTKPFLIVLLGDSYGSAVSKELLEPIYKANKLTYDGKEKSVTEVEIESSMIFDGDSTNKIVLNRTIKNLDKTQSSIYYDKENEEKLIKLKEKIISSIPKERVYNYSATLVDGQLQIDNIITFKEFIKKSVINILLENFKENKNKYEYLIKELEEKFEGRPEIYDLKEAIYASHKEGVTFYLIEGEAGIGKTTFACKLKSLIEQDGNVAAIHLCNEEKENIDLKSILVEMLKETDSFIEYDVIKNLQKLDKSKNYYFIFDSADQIVDSNQFDVYTSEHVLPDNVFFIMFVNGSKSYDSDYSLQELAEEDVLLIIKKELEINKKNVPPVFLFYIQQNIDKFQHLRNPSMLSLFINELCHLSKVEYEVLGSQPDFIHALTSLFMYKVDSFPKSINEYLDRLEEPVILILQLLALSRDGFDEEDIRSITYNLGQIIDIYLFREVIFAYRKMIRKLDSGKYIISNTILKNAVLESLTEEERKGARYYIISAIGGRGSKLHATSFKEILHQYLMNEDYEGIASILSLCYQNLNEQDRFDVGRYFQIISNQYCVNDINDVYLKISSLQIGRANLFLFDYCLYDMSELYVENSVELFKNLYENRSAFDNKYHGNISYYYLVGLIAHQNYKEAMKVYEECFSKYINYGIYIQILRTQAYSFDPSIKNSLATLVESCLEQVENSDKEILTLVDIYRLIEMIVLLEGNVLNVGKEILDKLFYLIHLVLEKSNKESNAYYQIMYMLKYMNVVFGKHLEYPYNEVDEFLAKNPDYIKTTSSAEAHKYMMINMFGEYVAKQDEEATNKLVEYIKYIIDNRVDMSLNDYLLTYKIFNRVAVYEDILDYEYVLNGYEYYTVIFASYFRESLQNRMVQIKMLNAILTGLFFNMDENIELFNKFEKMLHYFNDNSKKNANPQAYQNFMIKEFQFILQDLQDYDEVDKLQEYLEKFIHENVV